jgi:hypothetical protein
MIERTACGYQKKFKFNIDMMNEGVPADCIEWCEKNCSGKWGWWFQSTDLYDPTLHNYEEQNAFMSFEKKIDATKFWMSKLKSITENK